MIPQFPDFISVIKNLGASLETTRSLLMISGILITCRNYVLQ